MPQPMKPAIQLLAGTASQALGHQVAAHYGQSLGILQVKRFSDGEMYPQLGSNVQDAHVCLIQATYPSGDHMMELLPTIDAIKQAGARFVTAVIPYLGYMRQNRAHHVGGPIGVRLQAHLLAAAGVDQMITCDLHARPIVAFFDFPVEHLTSMSIFVPHLHRLQLPHVIFVAPDAGGMERARLYAQYFDVPMVLCDKHKPQLCRAIALQRQENIQGADVVIIDDIVDTGKTLFQTAAQLKAQGARTVRAFCTHPVLSGNAYDHLEASVLEEVVVTDTIPLQRASAKLYVCSTAPLFAQALQQLA